MYPAYNPTPSIHQQKKKHRNPFAFFFTRQYKSAPTKDIIPEKQGIFGVPLCDASKLGSILWDLQVPDPVALCFLEISKRGLPTEGIFRLSGATSEVTLLENEINMCSPDERKLINASLIDIHTLSSLVKKYLRALPEPVIPNAYHERFQDIDLDSYDGLARLSSVIVKLPFYNRQLLHAILLMSSQIQQHVNTNMMCPEALATVFAPVCTGFEQSLKDMHISNSSTTSNATFKKSKKYNNPDIMKSSEMIEKHIKRNKNWTNIWKMMIEQHASLIAVLDNQHYDSAQSSETSWKNRHVYYNHPLPNRLLPSPFSTTSTAPLPNDIMMAQFYPMTGGNVPVAQPQQYRYSPSPPPVPPPHYYEDPTRSNLHHSISKKASFFQKNNTIRKILSASTLR